MKIEGYEPRVQIVLDINENTNFDLINRNRKKFKELLRYLGQYQGSNLGLNRWRIFMELFSGAKKELAGGS